MRIVVVVSIMLLAVGCTSRHDEMVEQGFPVAYADGFAAGCHSGKKAGGSLFDQFDKNVARFEQEERYAQGWSDGFRQCESEEEAVERQVRMAIETQNMQDHHKDRIGHDVLKGIDTSALKNLN